jgi:SnoaL-like domain
MSPFHPPNLRIALLSASSSRPTRTALIVAMPRGQMSLFTADTHFVVYMNAKDPTPSQELHSREALAPVFADLNKYDATIHFVGQSTIFTLTSDRATGEAYCLSHHVTVDGGKRGLMVASLRYLDTFVKRDGAWLFAERQLYVDWVDEHPCHDRD